MAQKNKKSNQKNWFGQQIEKFGPEFISNIRADEAQKGAIRLFRDIARGNINIPTEGQYFLDGQFLENCIVAATSKYVYFSILFEGLEALARTDSTRSSDTNYLAVYRNTKNSMAAYGCILNTLNNIKATGDLGFLYTLVNQLNPYRFSI